MRRGDKAEISLTSKGRLLALATGSDAVTEHEIGINPLLEAFCSKAVDFKQAKADALAKLKHDNGFFIAPNAAPDIMAARRIDQNLDAILFETRRGQNGEVEAAIAFAAYRFESISRHISLGRELRFGAFETNKSCVGAYSSDSFGFLVRGEKLAKKLEEFHAALRAGKGIFAATLAQAEGAKLFKPDQAVSGVVLANTDAFRPEHIALLRQAQKDFESSLRRQA